jgi:hypothetical protein
MKTQLNSPARSQAGYAMLLVMILLAVSLIVVGATLHRTSTTSSLNDRNNLYVTSASAAEAATEKSIALMMNDFQLDGESRISARLARYQTNIPTSTENPFWANFEFSDAQGNVGQTYVYRTDTNANSAFVDLQDQYAGLKGFSSNYRVISNVRPLNSAYTFTNAVQQDIQLSEIPIFQFAIFYNGLMEYTWCAPLTVRGRVHANGDIYVGSISDLAFNYTVTTTGKIWSPPVWDSHTPSEFSGSVTYSGKPAPGYSTGVPSMVLPIGTSNSPTALHEIINPPPPGEDPNSPISFQRYYNKAGMLILVSNSTVNVVLKNHNNDPAPRPVNWTNVMYFVSITNSFYDEREGMSNRVTQIDVGKFITWAATNVDVGLKFGMMTGDKLNIIYVGDFRTPTSGIYNAVRLVNGTTLPSVGFTVATANPLYIWGVYNCPNSAYLNTTNTTASAPSSVICDALTILSPGWDDSKRTDGSGGHNAAKVNTVNTAIIAGAVYSTGSTDTTFSGGVMNLPRLLENWNGIKFTLNTSMVSLYNSVVVTRQFRKPGIYYGAPNRDFNFDQNFTSPDKLPPGTPAIRRLVRGSWCNPKPNSTNYNFASFNGQ